MRRAVWLWLAAVACAAAGAAPAWADDAVVEEEAAVVTSDEEGVVSDDDANGSAWKAQEVRPRKIGDRLAYIRQSTEAFADPDQPRGLELKYYFLLADDVEFPAGNLARDPAGRTSLTITGGEAQLSAAWQGRLPLAIEGKSADAGAEWQDYFALPAPRNLLALLMPRKSGDTALLASVRLEETEGKQTIKKLTAEREIPAGELPPGAAPAAILDTFDRPAGLSAKAAMFGRLTAVLKCVEGRYAVDLYSERLHPDSDCRVWLTPAGHAWGRATAVRFMELPLRRGDQVVDVTVLAVSFTGSGGRVTRIGFDYPLCSPAIVEQFRKMQAQQAQKPTAEAKPNQPDLAKMLGEDVLAEFESRLVNAPYK